MNLLTLEHKDITRIARRKTSLLEQNQIYAIDAGIGLLFNNLFDTINTDWYNVAELTLFRGNLNTGDRKLDIRTVLNFGDVGSFDTNLDGYRKLKHLVLDTITRNFIKYYIHDIVDDKINWKQRINCNDIRVTLVLTREHPTDDIKNVTVDKRLVLTLSSIKTDSIIEYLKLVDILTSKIKG